MAIEIDDSDARYVGIKLSGKLTAGDYEHFVPAVEAIVKERGRVRLLLEMHDHLPPRHDGAARLELPKRATTPELVSFWL